MKYEECVKHKVDVPDHTKSILTSKEFAQESKFISVARGMGKVKYENGKEIYENPYKSKDRRGRPSTQMLLYKEEMRKKEEIEKMIKDNPMLTNIDISRITAAGGAVNIIQCT
jgi:hypothetical protein